jgi:hypothetical protein
VTATAREVEGQPVTYLLYRISVQLCACYVSDYSETKAVLIVDLNYSKKRIKANFI